MNKKIRNLISSDKFFWPAMALMVILPLLFSAPPKRIMPFTETPTFDWPRVFSGDEPHYLLMLHSLVLDGDLNLKNNYESVHSGSWQAGRLFAWSALDHHSCWRIHGEIKTWIELVEAYGSRWYQDQNGNLSYKYLPNIPLSQAALDVERTWHPPAIPLILGTLLFPLRYFKGAGLEPGALFISALFSFLALLAFRRLLLSLSADRFVSNMTTAFVFLGTPWWQYSRTLFSESFITSFLVLAYGLAITYRSRFILGSAVSGLFFGVAMAIKPPALLFFLPVVYDRLKRTEFRSLAMLSFGPSLAVCAFLTTNFWMSGGVTIPYSGVTWGNPFIGLIGLLFSLEHGLIPFAPQALLLFYGWIKLWKEKNQDALLALGGGLAYFCFMMSWKSWDGGYCYGPRMIVPAIPFLFVGLFRALFDQKQRFRAPWVSIPSIALVLISLLINFLGTVPYYVYWSRHPLAGFINEFLLN
jgi:hypothetical protein